MRQSVEPALLTIPQVAQKLGIGETKAWDLVGRGEIASIRLGKCRRVPLAALDAFIETLVAEQGNGDD